MPLLNVLPDTMHKLKWLLRVCFQHSYTYFEFVINAITAALLFTADLERDAFGHNPWCETLVAEVPGENKSKEGKMFSW